MSNSTKATAYTFLVFLLIIGFTCVFIWLLFHYPFGILFLMSVPLLPIVWNEVKDYLDARDLK